MISAEVANNMSTRGKTENFLEYSQEWQKLREQKIYIAKKV